MYKTIFLLIALYGVSSSLKEEHTLRMPKNKELWAIRVRGSNRRLEKAA